MLLSGSVPPTDLNIPPVFSSLMFRIPTILTSQEILDKVLHRATKISIEDPNAMYRIKKLSLARLDSIAGNIDSTLNRFTGSFPSIDSDEGTMDMAPFFKSFISKHRLEITSDDMEFLEKQRISFSRFYFSLLDITADANEVKKALAAVQWARKKCMEICTKKQRQIRRMARISTMDSSRKEAIGRIASVMKQIGSALEKLAFAREQFKTFPTLSPGAPICVIAGYPNVGKSSFLRQISKARPEIASYPFTTRGINMGVYEIGSRQEGKRGAAGERGRMRGLYSRRINLVDTPGLLDRQPEERNAIEEQAAAALNHVADCILFILDPSGFCGYPTSPQTALLDSLREMFPDLPFIVVENKCDEHRSDSENLKMSTLTGEGIDEVVEAMERAIPDS